MATKSLQVRQVSNWLSYGRYARLDTETCNLMRVGQCSFGPHKPERPGATGAVEVFRGSSDRPLFVTAAGMEQSEAANCIQRMHGESRIPTLLKQVDRLSRIQVAGK